MGWHMALDPSLARLSVYSTLIPGNSEPRSRKADLKDGVGRGMLRRRLPENSLGPLLVDVESTIPNFTN